MPELDDIKPPYSPAKSWSFHNPVRIHFGRDVRAKLPEEIGSRRCLIVSTQRGRKQFTEDPHLGAIAAATGHNWLDTVTENPGLHYLQGEIDRLAGKPFDAIIAFGGGSAMDAAKVLAIALSDAGTGKTLADLLANPDLHKDAQPKPVYAIPTTSGTGSEVTPFATVWDHETKKKHSLAGPAMFPHAAYVDPALTDTVPPEVTLSTGLDAINQAAESIWNKNAIPITLDFATRALQLGFAALPKLFEGTGGQGERDQMSEASLLAGLAISHTRTALCHSISYPLTAHFGVPHGLACAFTMPAVLELNANFDDGRLERLAQQLLANNAELTLLTTEFRRLNEKVAVSSIIKDYCGTIENIKNLCAEMYTRGRSDQNMTNVDQSVLLSLIESAWFSRTLSRDR
ncbi:phosphonoacetaldehyde reductase [Methylonatrum kenyense]|uniref:phosphonoacetaldehyde reductase n=1 Tax=Methylonatrum kenyense TaxID=455253 RepID=UPI0020BE6273|nr:phosphonoacetaldehyde reductase [Methylonatrum kenyense]MCK8516964.1 phosphonoacetaldehyde reductase [Methylonatrum kenyense]